MRQQTIRYFRVTYLSDKNKYEEKQYHPFFSVFARTSEELHNIVNICIKKKKKSTFYLPYSRVKR